MKYIFGALFLSIAVLSCRQGASQKTKSSSKQSETTGVGGPCEGCEAIYTSPIKLEKLSWVDTLPDWNEKGPKLVMSGTVYESDGKTPAADVVLYVYHTDQTGHYTNRDKEEGWAGRNGYAKGWMKTDANGRYRFYTLKPAPYPGATIPAHIHPIVKEPDKNEYYIDEYRFDGDPFLTAAEKRKEEGRGGSGIVLLQEKEGVWYGERNIYLGQNIPDYPSKELRK